VLLVVVALGIATAFVAFVLLYFEPQDLFIDRTVNESLPRPAPVAAAASADGGGHNASISLGESGRFRSGEHSTSGIAQLVNVPGRGTYVRLSELRTANGPALHVWLSAAANGSSNGTIGSSAHVDLGELKGNIGSSNYPLPPDVDLAALPSVTIWCDRFNVSFAAAALKPE
jgi:hypothetical protein